MPNNRGRFFKHAGVAAAAVLMLSMSASWAVPRVAEVEAQLPTAFLPGGVLGMQPGGSWAATKHNPALLKMSCQSVEPKGAQFDEVCFFRTSAASRVAGAAIHDGFIVRQGRRLVLIGTGITIKNAEDPLAAEVVHSFEHQTHLAFQHKGDEVLFAQPLGRHLSQEELAGYAQRAPALLVQLEHQASELAVLYGYLGPVNVFGALAAE